eukprot:8654932-Pyramimonas_sp.AAC.1
MQSRKLTTTAKTASYDGDGADDVCNCTACDLVGACNADGGDGEYDDDDADGRDTDGDCKRLS